MKPYFKNIIIPVMSAIVGASAAIAAIKISPTLRTKIEGIEDSQYQKKDLLYDDIINKQNSIRLQFDNIFDDEFFGQKDPFEEMKKMREKMKERMERFGLKPQSRSNPFDSWFSDKFGGGTINDISKREDENYVYYDIKVDDLNSTSINTQIKDGYITISGTVEKKSGKADEKDSLSLESVYRSSFNRTFPLPDHVDGNKMEVVPEKNKVVLKFPKMKT